MHPSVLAFVFPTAVSATVHRAMGQRSALMALRTVIERQTQVCVPVPVPATCEKSCGPGNIPCISFPTCYNPSAGESCCSDGTYCPAGYYCTNAGCCPNGIPLADCDATVSLSVIPPPAATSDTGTLSATSTVTPRSVTTAPETSTKVSTVTATSETTAPETSTEISAVTPTSPSTTATPETTIEIPTVTISSPLPPRTTPASNGTTKTSQPSPSFTAGAGQLGVDVLAALGVLGALVMVL
ncbi:hypothetical protein VTI74DRAFT_10680 [Chaetomium olivicolor]